ncbi:MAG: tripartite tricarboxylate transporter TctB family protein [Alphaproteobacteria bacterium]|nr:tripartite tricarboxylate transporter TctB family protein [Alphaproteobacteria bacterium]MDA8003302.1 tripartite tricarboxylate transporter TctB family protein [Alphaproteobacteria bacterium]MDA8005010.1 tripartite tricarboxylate transporter TctB family protein [Alphaproteobacteria bacterium]MDA8012377.1 tripartite tricarboxylate transporter TctB family protein [Alphaproteobacteria bacterium]
MSRDFTPGAVILIVCGWLLYLTAGFEVDPFGVSQGFSATRMPRLAIGVIAGLAVLMIVRGIRAGRAEAAPAPPRKMWATAVILAVAAALIETIGVLLVFFAVCVAVPMLWGARNRIAVLVFAVAMPVAVFIVFQGLLGLRLPLGPLSFLAI